MHKRVGCVGGVWGVLPLLIGLLVVGCAREAPEPASSDVRAAESGESSPAVEPVQRHPDSGLLLEPVWIGGQTFELELALDDEARYRGLSDRSYIAADGGMLFAYPSPGNLAFVMRDCLVPIDLICLDARGRIVALHEMKVEPYGRADWRLPRYRSGEPAQFAIELRGGMIRRLGLEEGQRIELDYERLGELAE